MTPKTNMKVLTFENQEDWQEARRGKITGTKLKDIVLRRGTTPKIGFYELIAERLASAPGEESQRDIGIALEGEAIEKFVEETGKKVDTSLVIWTREDVESIAGSPDGFIGEKEAVEAKCLSSARHIEAYLTQKVPADFEMQTTQYFVVNDSLKKLYVVFYDPRLIVKQLFYLTVERKEVEDQIKFYLDYEKKTIEEVNEIVNKLSF